MDNWQGLLNAGLTVFLLLGAVILWNAMSYVERKANELYEGEKALRSAKEALENSYDRKDFEHSERLQALTTALAEEQKRSRSTINAIELERANWQRRAEQMELQWKMQRDLNIEARQKLAKFNELMVED